MKNKESDMPVYKITKIMQYTEELEIEAEDRQEAIELGYVTDGERNNDDTLYDISARLRLD